MKPLEPRITRRAQRGLTLVETCCASAILALAIAGLSNVAATSAAVHRAALQKDAALRAVEDEIAAIISTPIADIPATFDNAGFLVVLDGEVGNALRPLAGDPDGLPGSVDVTAPTGDASALVEVVVRVDWQSAHGAQSVMRKLRLSRLGGA